MRRLFSALAPSIAAGRNLLMGGFLNAAGLGFAIYVGVILLPGIRGTPAMLQSVRAGDISIGEASGGGLVIAVPVMLLGLLVFARHGAMTVLTHFRAALMFLWAFTCLVLVLTVPFGDHPDAFSQLAQYLVTLGGFVLCMCFWQAPARDVDNALAMAFAAIAAGLIVAAVVQGFHDYRWVGLIHPNHYARYAYIALVLHSILTRRVSLLVFLPCFAASYIVSARTVMIGIVVFYLGYLCCTARGIPIGRKARNAILRLLAGVLIALPVICAVVLRFIDSERLLERLTNDLAVFDTERGVFSGFTGRSESWNAFFDSMDQFVFYGYGFRSSRYNMHTVHSGILSYFMDFGLLLGGLLLTVIVLRTVYLIWSGLKLPDQRSLICGLALASTLLIQCFEPDNFNIGFIGAFFFMMILGYARPPLHRAAVRKLVWRATDPVPPTVTPALSGSARDNAGPMRPYRNPQRRQFSISESTKVS